MYIFDAEYVENHLSSKVCTDVMENVIREERKGSVTQYLRTAIQMPNTNILGIMPGYFEKGYFGAKVLSVYHTNQGTGFPSHQGEVILFSKEHGEVLAVVDAMAVTRIRTGAVSAVASKVFARPGAENLAILGCGAQGHSHLDAICSTMKIRKVTVWDQFRKAADGLAAYAEEKGIEAHACDTAREAVREADIVCTVTLSHEPILKREWLSPGTHVNAIGACAPADREIDTELAAESHFFGDNRDSVMHESGDFLIPIREGAYGEDHFAGTLGDVLLGKIQGRKDDREITVFEGLGMAVEDIACAAYLYENALKGGKA